MNIKSLILVILAGLCTVERVYSAAALEQLELNLSILAKQHGPIPALPQTKITTAKIQETITALTNARTEDLAAIDLSTNLTEEFFRGLYLQAAGFDNPKNFLDPNTFADQIKTAFKDDLERQKKLMELDEILKTKWRDIEKQDFAPEPSS